MNLYTFFHDFSVLYPQLLYLVLISFLNRVAFELEIAFKGFVTLGPRFMVSGLFVAQRNLITCRLILYYCSCTFYTTLLSQL